MSPPRGHLQLNSCDNIIITSEQTPLLRNNNNNDNAGVVASSSSSSSSPSVIMALQDEGAQEEGSSSSLRSPLLRAASRTTNEKENGRRAGSEAAAAAANTGSDPEQQAQQQQETEPLIGTGDNDGSENNDDDNRRVTLSSFRRQLSRRFSSIWEEHTGSIGYLGSVAIAVNSLTGPAMLNLPATFARSGIVPTCSVLVVVCVLSALCSLHVANCISKVQGDNHDDGRNNNRDFQREVEYSQVFEHFWGKRWFAATQIIFFACITCLNMSSIVDTAQVVDTFLGHWWPYGGSFALEFFFGDDETTNSTIIAAAGAGTGTGGGFVRLIQWDYKGCTREALMEGSCIPFGESGGILLLTLGTAITTIIFLPLALMDLKENAALQIFGFLVLLVCSLQFVIQFATSPTVDPSRVALWGTDWGDLVGVVLFNFALVIVIPAWLYEREPQVNAPVVVHGSSVFSTILYVAIGLLGNLAMPNVSDNMLETMMSGAYGTTMQLGASVFAFFIIGLGIPLFSVLTRLNLTGSGLCSHGVGNALAVYFPFGVAWMLYHGQAVTKLLSWGGVLFTSLVAFILPLVLTLHVVKEYWDREGSIDVYNGWFKDSQKAQLISLRILLVVAVVAIVVAILGNIVS